MRVIARVPGSRTTRNPSWVPSNIVTILHGEVPSAHVAVNVRADEVAVTIVDDGPGIPDAERAILTDREAPDAMSQRSGLGLWLVYRAVRRSHGRSESIRRIIRRGNTNRLSPSDEMVRRVCFGYEDVNVLVNVGGIEWQRTAGDHPQLSYTHPTNETDRRFVTVPLHDEFKVGTLRDIAESAGAKDFEAFRV